jgi:ElaB/YqjD/DUF883 family membrane-anchored ribosome-binding protein
MSDLETPRGDAGAQPLGEEPGATAPGEPAAKTDPEDLRRDIEHTRAELGDTVEALSHKANVRAQISKRVEERTAGLRARKAELRQRQQDLKARVADARGRASETTPEHAKTTPEDAKRTASRFAHTAEQRPLSAIGVAFGAGLLLGWLIGRP